MLSSKSKSGLSNVANNKDTPAIKISRLRSTSLDSDSPSPQKNTSFSIDGSPKSADSKLLANRRSMNISTTDKRSRSLKGSELQVQLTAVQENLKKAKERLVFEEIEKAQVLEELNDAKKEVQEVSEKLAEALLAQKKAKESSEIDKFRADELEQSAIEAAQKREEEWNKELEDIRNQHAVDVEALLSATQELQRVKQELVMTTDAKNSALNRADDTMKIAGINAEKVEILAGDIDRLKSLLDSQLENKSNETALVLKKLSSEADALKRELEKAKVVDEKLVEMDALVEGLRIEQKEAKKAESDAVGLVNEWKKKAEVLESCLEAVKQSERAVQGSLHSLTKQLEESKSMLDDVESEVISLSGKVESLELEVTNHKAFLEDSEHQLDLANQDVLDVEKTVTFLKSEIQRVEEEKAQALNNEKLTSSNVESLTQENSKLAVEQGITREDSEKSKKAMEGLASALHEVSIEVKDIQERLLIKQTEVDSVTGEVDKLQLAVKVTQETYEVMLDEAKYEIICLKKTVEKSETEAKDLRTEWDAKEINLRTAIKKTDEEIVSIKLERDKATGRLERKKFDAKAAVEEANRLHDKIRSAESVLVAANNAIEKAKAESRSLKEKLLDKENELQNITQENDDLRVSETAASQKIKELSESLAKLSSKKDEENGDTRRDTKYGLNREPSNNDKEDDNLSTLIEAMDVKVDETETVSSKTPSEVEEVFREGPKLEDNGTKIAEEMDPVKMESKICEGVETADKQMTSEMASYAEPIDDELDAKIDGSNLDQLNGQSAQNGNTFLNKHQQLQKKKKALLHKFGGLLKKKTTSK